VRLRSDGVHLSVEEPVGPDAAAATIVSTTEAFLAWSTTRLPWNNLVRIDGATHAAAEFLDAINLI
jgi:hypothetical protein